MRINGIAIVVALFIRGLTLCAQDQATPRLISSDGFGQVVQRPAGPPPTPAHTVSKRCSRGC
jgi:hypothetical protein